MADDFTERYRDLLTGSYDCVDRIVLNAYYPLGHNPGGQHRGVPLQLLRHSAWVAIESWAASAAAR